MVRRQRARKVGDVGGEEIGMRGEKQAALVRWSRVIGGAHYPSDVAAGKILGEIVARELLKSPKMQQALAEIRAEIYAHLRKKAA